MRPILVTYDLTHTRTSNSPISTVKSVYPLTCCSGSVSVNMKPLLHKYVNIHSMNPRHPTVSLGLPLSELFWSSEEREREEKKDQEKSIQRQKILHLSFCRTSFWSLKTPNKSVLWHSHWLASGFFCEGFSRKLIPSFENHCLSLRLVLIIIEGKVFFLVKRRREEYCIYYKLYFKVSLLR